MEIIINSQRNNNLLNRTEVYFTVKHPGESTPSRELIRGELADKLNAKKENVIVNSMHTDFGAHELTGYAKVYTSFDKSKGVEQKHILVRNKLLVEEPKKEKKAVEKPPAPSKKEEPVSQKPAVETPPKTETKQEKPVKTEKPKEHAEEKKG